MTPPAEAPSPAELAERRVLVTGASGFIGRHLTARLEKLGAEVHRCSRQPAVEGERAHAVDLCDPEAAAALVDKVAPEIVFHLASEVTGSRDAEAVLPTFRANLASTVYLLDAVLRTGCQRFVQAGSLEEPDPGEALPVPASPYAAAKHGASAYCRMYHRLYELPVVLARLFMVYGPGQRDHSKLVPYITLALLRGETPSLGSGKRPVDWIYVDDAVEGLLAAAVAPRLEGRRVDFGSGKLVPVKSVVEQIYERLAPGVEPPFGSRPDRPMEQVRVASVEETEELTGWRAATKLADGVAATVEWYRGELEAGRIT